MRSDAVLSEEVSGSDDIKEYHHRTKHRFEAYAKGPQTLDWDDQPNPFRSFSDTSLFELPLNEFSRKVRFCDYKDIDASSLNFENISLFLRYSMGLMAWKQYGPDRWSLRANPSSGNLHPTETYLLFPNNLQSMEAGLYHYNVALHGLEKRNQIREKLPQQGCFYVAFSSVMWREAWKYGERGFRYCQLDMGHVIAAICHSTAALGWQVQWLNQFGSHDLSNFLGLQDQAFDGVAKEEAECILKIDVNPLSEATSLTSIPSLSDVDWLGKANNLEGRSPYKWPWVERAAQASELLGKSTDKAHSIAGVEYASNIYQKEFQQVVAERRSAQSFAKESISIEQFARVLNAVRLTEQSLVDEQCGGLQLVIMVHRVDGVAPGLYCLTGSSEMTEELKKCLTKWNDWEQVFVPNLDSSHQLYLLKESDYQKLNGTFCCHQKIASNCSFSVGFLAPFDQILESENGFGYRTMHWQAGFIAHQIYLSATANDIAATGIGCFFDDAFHEFLGLNGTWFQFLYHIAVGHPDIDRRVTSMSGYYHLPNRSKVTMI